VRPSAVSWRGRWGGYALHQTNQLDKDGVLSDHGCASEGRVLGHTPSSEAFLAQSRPSPEPHVIYVQSSISLPGDHLEASMGSVGATMAPRTKAATAGR